MSQHFILFSISLMSEPWNVNVSAPTNKDRGTHRLSHDSPLINLHYVKTKVISIRTSECSSWLIRLLAIDVYAPLRKQYEASTAPWRKCVRGILNMGSSSHCYYSQSQHYCQTCVKKKELHVYLLAQMSENSSHLQFTMFCDHTM